MGLRELTIDELMLVSGGDDPGGGQGGGIDNQSYYGGPTQAPAQTANYYGAFDNGGFPTAYVNLPVYDAMVVANGMSGSNGLSEGSSFGNDFGDANSGPGGADPNSNVA